MKILFIGSLCSTRFYKEGLKNGIRFDNAALILQKKLINALTLNKSNVDYLLTAPNISFRDKKILPREIFSLNSTKNCLSVGFLNIPGLKQLYLYQKSNDIIKNVENIDVILVYSIQSHLLRWACQYKKHNPTTKIVLIVTDLPEYMSSNKGIIYLLMKKIESKLVKYNIDAIDGYILLSSAMQDKLTHSHDKSIIIEGIASNPKKTPIINRKDLNLFKICYTGSLTERYGVKNLIDAFLLTECTNYRLIICGSGGLEKYILQCSEKDKRIIYKGQLSPHEVHEQQILSDLLINPRDSSDEYNKYSFPSKTIEYLQSGTPCLICKMESIPNEYFNYCYSVNNMTIETIKKAIIDISSKSANERKKLGLQAKEFIDSNKNELVQGKKIIQFLEKLSCRNLHHSN